MKKEGEFVKTRALSSLLGRIRAVPRLDVELTERCDNACVHCFINKGVDDEVSKGREMSTAELRRILKRAADTGVLTVRLTGGEPLVREDFDEVYLHARGLGLRVLLFTNARGVTEERADLLGKVPPLEPIEITVYGMTASTYDGFTRSPGAFAQFQGGVERLRVRGIPFVVKAVLHPAFAAERALFESWAATIPWMHGPPRYTTRLDLRARRDDDAAAERIRKLRPLLPGSPPSAAESAPLDAAAADFYSRLLGPPGEQLFRCGAGRKCSVDAYGNLQPCLQLRHPATVFNLREGSLTEGIEALQQMLPSFRAQSPAYLERCAKCFLKSLCEQCPAKAWMEHGTLDDPVDYFCRLAHTEAMRLGLLDPGERSWEVNDWRERVRRLADGPAERGAAHACIPPGMACNGRD